MSGKNYAVYVIGKELQAIDIDGRTVQQINDVIGNRDWYGTIASSPAKAINWALRDGFSAPVGASYKGNDGAVTYLGNHITKFDLNPQATTASSPTRPTRRVERTVSSAGPRSTLEAWNKVIHMSNG